MLLYGLRNIAGAKFNSPAFQNASPFVTQKAKAQSAKLSEKDVRDLYSAFYKLDKNVKTGKVLPDVLIPLAIEKVLVYIQKKDV
jgi:hypothetical protein